MTLALALMISCSGNDARQSILKVYNWADYIDEDVLADGIWETTVEKVREFVLHLALQIAALHSYDEVKLVGTFGFSGQNFLDAAKAIALLTACRDTSEAAMYAGHWDAAPLPILAIGLWIIGRKAMPAFRRVFRKGEVSALHTP